MSSKFSLTSSFTISLNSLSELFCDRWDSGIKENQHWKGVSFLSLLHNDSHRNASPTRSQQQRLCRFRRTGTDGENWSSLSNKEEARRLIDICLLRCIRIRFAGLSIRSRSSAAGKHKSCVKRRSQPVIVLARSACINRTFNFFNGILTWTSLFGRESRHRRGAGTRSRLRACERARLGASLRAKVPLDYELDLLFERTKCTVTRERLESHSRPGRTSS